ncbi:MAG: 4a-hydroxytetrahydrobiopterin dehydratase [Phycisphaeraceae bacterium]|nr:4a-hydroxytetrahydrobiopterin dehydratase [Phycisphaeraceae bacterium]
MTNHEKHPRPVPLSPQAVASALSDLPAWRFEGDSLRKSFAFADFKQALGFIVRVGLCAEELSHHPDLHNVYNRVEIALSTHDAGHKVTAKDVQLAQAIEKNA